MDKGTQKFLWLIARTLNDCAFDEPAQRAEFLEISQRLRRLAGRVPDQLSCERLGGAIGAAERGRDVA